MWIIWAAFPILTSTVTIKIIEIKSPYKGSGKTIFLYPVQNENNTFPHHLIKFETHI
uniref:Secreted protein n=1 Tax=Heterorhabditis bacteriophora TaxID=37862 RepID=A0A1I7W8D0_HETBA